MSQARVLIVTGGGRGIGAAVSRLAGARGYHVAVNYLNDRASAERVVADIERSGGSAAAIAADVSKMDDIVRLCDETERLFGKLTHLVNNAGMTGLISRLDAATPETIRVCLELNTIGAILAAREAVLRMAPRHGGSGGAIVNISSGAVSLGSPGEYVWYAASKGAIDSFTIGLSKEVAEDSIRVNAVAPGLTETELHARSSGEPGRVARMRPVIPMQRAGAPEEVAEAVLFLLSDAASYITGTVLRVAGGR